MPIYTLKIPQVGESVVEARVVRLLKNERDSVQRDEPLAELETDKSVFTVDSPIEGVIDSWCVTEESTFPIGEVLCYIRYGEATDIAEAEKETELPQSSRIENAGNVTASVSNGMLSPRIKRYCREKNISPEEIIALASALKKRNITIDDIDAWRAGAPQKPYTDKAVSSRQQNLSAALMRGWNTIVPGVIERRFHWDALKQANAFLAAQKVTRLRGSYLHIIAWGVAQSMKKYPQFRSRLMSEDALREYHTASLGIAVTMPNGDLATAVIEDAARYDVTEMGEVLLKEMAAVRNNETNQSLAQLVVSDLSSYGVHSAVPIIAPPSAATLFVGSPYEEIRMAADGSIEKYFLANLVLAFDHRFINGVEAAKFLNDICRGLEELPGNLNSKTGDNDDDQQR